MLKQILCDKFVEPRIIFHEGLNVIVGDDIASNSIGKSSMLMIIDFVFGGDDYVQRNRDTVEHLGHHSFKFSFEFSERALFFSRSTNEPKTVFVCDEQFQFVKPIDIKDYTKILQTEYKCELEDLFFRNIVGRYFRVYGKENLNERKPIQYFEKETQRESILALLKLFDRYKDIKEIQDRVQQFTKEKQALAEAAKRDIIPNITKTLFGRNEKQILELQVELERLKNSIVNSSASIEALVSKEILELRNRKSELIIQKSMYENRLKRTLNNISTKNVYMDSELERFVSYFPDFNVEQANIVDSFHSSLTNILKQELEQSKREISKQILVVSEAIGDIDQEINDKLSVQDAPRYTVDKIVELAAHIKQLTEENGFYTKKKNIEDSLKEITLKLESMKEKSLDDICSLINGKMYELNKQIYEDNRRPPTLSIHGDRYSFNTYGDTGTGTAFANLITFDLAVLELTRLPAIAHDLPLLKNIENAALEHIIEIYNRSQKQIFVVIDKLDSYADRTVKLVTRHKVLQLSKDKILFIKNWKMDGE